ncbi:MAG: hypothetical protein KJZ86_23825 [Caldilineaceae bacterium]|nr:hypothetical protein [Caldilineaceae bacterium]
MKNRLAFYAVAYGFWGFSILLGLLAGMIVRETVIFALISSDADRYVIHLGTQLITVVLGLVLLVVIVILENRYRVGLAKGRSRGYFLRFFGATLLVMAVTHLWYVAVAWGLGTLDTFRLTAGLVEVVVGSLSLQLARRSFPR